MSKRIVAVKLANPVAHTSVQLCFDFCDKTFKGQRSTHLQRCGREEYFGRSALYLRLATRTKKSWVIIFKEARKFSPKSSLAASGDPVSASEEGKPERGGGGGGEAKARPVPAAATRLAESSHTGLAES